MIDIASSDDVSVCIISNSDENDKDEPTMRSKPIRRTCRNRIDNLTDSEDEVPENLVARIRRNDELGEICDNDNEKVSHEDNATKYEKENALLVKLLEFKSGRINHITSVLQSIKNPTAKSARINHNKLAEFLTEVINYFMHINHRFKMYLFI